MDSNCPQCGLLLLYNTYRFKNGQTVTIQRCRYDHGAWVPDEFFTAMENNFLMANLMGQHAAEIAIERIR